MSLGILFITKSLSAEMVVLLKTICKWLYKQNSELKLFINEKVPDFPDYCRSWNPQLILEEYKHVDLVVTIGGDGTVLYSSWLFQNSNVPPTMSFSFGSLGFLTSFDISSIKNVLMDWISNPQKYTTTKRMRLMAQVSRYEAGTVSIKSQKSNSFTDIPDERPFDSVRQYLPSQENWLVLNDVVIDRGPSAYMTQLEVMVDNKDCTVVQADGLLFATPTGSTAYSVRFKHAENRCLLVDLSYIRKFHVF